MKTTALALVGVVFLALIGGVPNPDLEGPQPSVDGAIAHALWNDRTTYCTFYNDPANPPRPVPRGDIPAHVLDNATRWVARVLRSPWVPSELLQRWQAEVRRVGVACPVDVDYLRAEYNRGGAGFGIWEDGTGGVLLWRNPNLQVGDDAGRTALLLAQCLLNIPDDQAPSLHATLRPAGDAQLQLYVGVIKTDRAWRNPCWPFRSTSYVTAKGETIYNMLVHEPPLGDRAWYDSMMVWIAPGLFYVSISERDPVKDCYTAMHPETGVRYTGLPPRRFKNQPPPPE